MSSLFKRLLSRELGEVNYNKYFFCYQKLIAEKKYDTKKLENREVYDDIYNFLKEKDEEILQEQLEGLLETMIMALRISRQYMFVFICYLLTSLFLISQGLMLYITISAIVLLSVCFLYKTYEFIVNKYCYIDAHIVIIYKSVLDSLLSSKN